LYFFIFELLWRLFLCCSCFVLLVFYLFFYFRYFYFRTICEHALCFKSSVFNPRNILYASSSRAKTLGTFLKFKCSKLFLYISFNGIEITKRCHCKNKVYLNTIVNLTIVICTINIFSLYWSKMFYTEIFLSTYITWFTSSIFIWSFVVRKNLLMAVNFCSQNDIEEESSFEQKIHFKLIMHILIGLFIKQY